MTEISAISRNIHLFQAAQAQPAGQPAEAREETPASENTGPAEQILYLIKQAAEKNLGSEYIAGIKDQILALPDDNDDKPKLLIIFCQTFFALGQIDRKTTEELLLKTCQIKPNDKNILLELYRFYLGGQEFDKALNFLNQCIALYPDETALSIELASFYVLQNNFDKALEILEKLQKANPRYSLLIADVRHKQAVQMLKNNQPSRAYHALLKVIKLYNKARTQSPSPLLDLKLAEIYLTFLKANRQMILEEQRLSSSGIGIEFYKKNVDSTLRQMDFLLQGLSKAAKNQPLLYPEIARLYITRGKIDQALKVMQQAAAAMPDDPQVRLELADLLLASGDIKTSLTLLAGIMKNCTDLALLSQVYSRVSLIRTQLDFIKIQKQYNQPTALQQALNFLIMVGLAILNPYFAVANTLGMLANKALSKNLNENEVQEITTLAGNLETQAIEQIRQESPPAILFIALEQIEKANALGLQIEDMAKRSLVSREGLDAYRNFQKQEKQKAIGLLNLLLDETYIKEKQAEFDAAQDYNQRFAIARHYLELSLMFDKVSSQADLDPEISKILLKKSQVALKKGRETLESLMAIAQEKQDIEPLLALGQAAEFFGLLSLEALSLVLEIVANDPQKLVDFCRLMVSLWRKNPDNIILCAAFKSLAIKALKQLVDITGDADTKVSCLRQLFMLGDHETAYLGMVNLVNEYKTKAPDKLPGIFYELGLMSLVRGKKDKALEWFKRSKLFTAEELNIFLAENDPAFTISSSPEFQPFQIRAMCLLYTAWASGQISADLYQLAVSDLYATKSKRAVSNMGLRQQQINLRVTEKSIDVIEVRGNKKTKSQKIIAELATCGLTAGMAYTIDIDALNTMAEEASKRLKCFYIKNIHYEEEQGVTTLVVEVEEVENLELQVGGSYGNMASFVGGRFGYNNLLGGGERIGVEFKYNWFYPEGIKHFNSVNAGFYYEDPHLFTLGKDHAVAGNIKLDYTPRPNYDTNGFETITGGSLGIAVRLAQNTNLIIAPSFYHVNPEKGNNYFETSLGLGIEYDGRDNIFFPGKGIYFSSMLTPGTQINNHEANPYFIKLDNDLRGYVPLPYGMVLAMRGVFGFGFNLTGSNRYFIGGNMLNPYVRAAGNSSAVGSAILSASIELRSPVIDLELARIQPYIFCDAASMFSRSFLYGCGAGVRALVPLIGLINIGIGYPGAFYLWFGPMGWN